MPRRKRTYNAGTFTSHVQSGGWRQHAYARRHLSRSVIGKSLNVIHHFKRSFEFAPIAIKDVFYNNALSIMLSQLPNYAEFTTLFDAYRIRKIQFRFINDQNVSNFTNTNAALAIIPNMYSVKDYDDDTALTVSGDYEQYQNFSIRRMDKPIIVTIYPRPAVASYSGAFTSYGQSSNKLWMDCGSPNVKYYGLKYAFDGTVGGSSLNSTVISNCKIICTVWLDMKEVR